MQALVPESASWRRHPYIWSALLLGAALGWIVTIQQAGAMTAPGSGMSGMMTAHTAAAVFVPVWIAMMAGMMFPAIAPVVSLVSAVNRKQREGGNRATSTAVFVAGYLVVWTLFGCGAYLLSLVVPSLDMAAAGIKSANSLIAGLILIGAGVYEWSPLKEACLRHCRSPLGVFIRYWRNGRIGAVRMGIIHGALCLGCCWGLMLVLFAVGLMNLYAMVALAAVIFAQKVLPHGESIGKATGVALVITGLVFAL